MKLGELARVARGVVTGNRHVFIMSRAEARRRGIESFAKPIIGGARDVPKGVHVVRDHEDREVLIVASNRDVEAHPGLRAYLGLNTPRVASVHPAPIAVTYVGTPRFVANPDGLVITNALYGVTPRQKMSATEVAQLVERLNKTMQALPATRFATRYTPRGLESIEI